MSDPLGGSPIRDHPGTVRGDEGNAWIKVGRLASNDREGWVDTTYGERVSDHVMWLMKLPVVGAVPGSLADHDRKTCENAELDLLRLFVAKARDWLDADPGADTDEDVVHMVLNLMHDLWMRAQNERRPIVELVDGGWPAGRGGPPCPDELCLLEAGHSGQHGTWVRPERELPVCDEEDDEVNPRRCTYDLGHLGPHSFEPTRDGQPRCQSYTDRPCLYPVGHEGSHSYEGKCAERAATGRLCDLSGDHDPETPHDWMFTFGNPNSRCRTIWTQDRGGFGRVWRCMYEEDHDGDCSFVLRQRGAVRCGERNEHGARCVRRSGHGAWHRYLEATRGPR